MRNVIRPARGFTLIEIMIVVMIIGIIAGLAIPYYQKMTARAHRSEVPVVLNKLRQYFVNLYQDTGGYVTPQNGVAVGGEPSAWNPPGDPGPGGQWAPHAAGWEDIPFPPEGNIKLRYQYSIDTTDQMTFYICGIFPGFGAPTQHCGAAGSALHGNYTYQETLKGQTTLAEAEWPAPGF